MKDVIVFNSLSNKKEVFKPIKDKEVSIYVCGPTVYSDPHIGNCRPAVVFDLLRRLFLFLGYDVKYVSNFTDVDDKIINKAIERNISEKELTDFYIKEYLKIMDVLNVLKATQHPRVTEYMDDIISYIDNLVKTNHAYFKNDNVYFRINSISNYGKLSNVTTDDLIAGSRIKENEDKENPFDFVLWKKTDKGITWDSPWGKGRPGWHTECVVMISKIFGKLIDIHGGGFDLKFPHHENEIAQCKATYNTELANYWMHNGFIDLNNQKMSKSLGNVINAKDFISKHGGLFVRYTLLNCHYRAPLKLSDELLENNLNEINKIQKTLNDVRIFLQFNEIDYNSDNRYNIDKFIDYLCDDLNISNAMSELFNETKIINQELRKKDKDIQTLILHHNNLLKMINVLGLRFDIIILEEKDKELLKAYNLARANKDFAKSDEIRKELIERKLI